MLKPSGKWLVVLIAAAIGCTGFGIFLALRPSTTSQTSVPSPAPTNEQPAGSVSALGRLEPGGEVFCVYPTSSSGISRVGRLMVKEGDRVQENQVIAVMDTYNRLMAAAVQSQAQVREAQTRVAQASTGAKPAEVQAQQAQISARRADIDRLNAELENARREYARFEALYRDGAISQSDFDRRRLSLQTTQAGLQRAVRELQQAQEAQVALVQVRPVDVQQAEAQVQVALASLERAKAELETAAVRSPIAGRVLKVHAKAGEQVGSGPLGGSTSTQTCNGIVELGRTEQMYAVAEVYETDIGRVRQGQKATITSAAFPEEISGTVESIGLKIGKKDVLSTDPAADTDARVVEVKIRLNDSKLVERFTNLQVNVAIAP